MSGGWFVGLLALGHVLEMRLNSDRLPLQDYDPDGEYIRHWIPELKNVPTSRIHEPWLMGKDEMVK